MSKEIEQTEVVEAEAPRKGPRVMDTSTVEINPSFLEECKERVSRLDWKPKHLRSWLLLEHGIDGVEAKAYCDTVFPASPGTNGPRGYMHILFDRLAQGSMTDNELEEFLRAQGEKALGRFKEIKAFMDLANHIWAVKQ